MPPINPNARTWTLRLKHHRTTILLHADPIQKLSSLRAELLNALHQTNPPGMLDGYQIPQNADDIILARPVDINDLSAGWERLESKTPFEDANGNAGEGKGKGKAAAVMTTPGSGAGAKGKGGKDAKMTDCPQGVGLRDGGVLAFRFRSEDEAGTSGRREVGDDEFEVLEEDRAEKWDVVVPTIEDTYAEEDAMPAETAVGAEGRAG